MEERLSGYFDRATTPDSCHISIGVVADDVYIERVDAAGDALYSISQESQGIIVFQCLFLVLRLRSMCVSE